MAALAWKVSGAFEKRPPGQNCPRQEKLPLLTWLTWECVRSVKRKLLWFFSVSNSEIYTAILSFSSNLLKQILMTAQVIPVRTTGPVQTEWTDSTAVVHQALMAHDVKQVTVLFITCTNTFFFIIHEQGQDGAIDKYSESELKSH